MEDYMVHESSYIDDNVIIGEKTKIWHFCHVQSGARIGKRCSLGQNVNISNNVIISFPYKKALFCYSEILSQYHPNFPLAFSQKLEYASQ